MTRAEDRSGFFMYFDASREMPGLRGLTEDEKIAYLDSVRSVSGIGRGRGPADVQDGCDTPEGFLKQLEIF